MLSGSDSLHGARRSLSSGSDGDTSIVAGEPGLQSAKVPRGAFKARPPHCRDEEEIAIWRFWAMPALRSGGVRHFSEIRLSKNLIAPVCFRFCG